MILSTKPMYFTFPNTMVFQNAFDHILAPVDDYQIQALRNATLCGVLAFAFLIVGVNQLITLLVYLFVIAFACVTAWLYSLVPDVRSQVLGRICDVVKTFWRRCVNESFGTEESCNCGNAETYGNADTDQTLVDEDESRRIDLLADDFTGLFK